MSEVDSWDWEGISRPDAPAPHGFQGLVQQTGSGPYRVPLELNSHAQSGSRFILTPIVTIDGQCIALPPIKFKTNREGAASPELLAMAGVACLYRFDRTGASIPGLDSTALASLSQRTPRGLLMYDVVMTCNSGGVPWTIRVRNYQKP